ncbi:MAG: hypothetical protein SFW63_08475 [Alphaproteobacteria bacterium]|nr:hypothetical protein [Alphaproteobacteria bacterium]
MNDQEAPKKYKFFDGFVKSNLLIKALYVLTFPSLVVPILVEGLEYRNAQNRIEGHEDKQLNAISNRIQTASTSYAAEQTMNENLAKSGTYFQDMVSPKKDPEVCAR